MNASAILAWLEGASGLSAWASASGPSDSPARHRWVSHPVSLTLLIAHLIEEPGARRLRNE